MLTCDTLIRNATIYDGSNAAPQVADIALRNDRILAIGPSLTVTARNTIHAEALALAPGFIDTHTHDDTSVIRNPAMLPKISQGVTTVITGNCGISAAPVTLTGAPPDPMRPPWRCQRIPISDLRRLHRGHQRSPTCSKRRRPRRTHCPSQ